MNSTVVPGALTVGELSDAAAAIAPRPLKIEGLVDGLNRQISMADLKSAFKFTTKAYEQGRASGHLALAVENESAAAWLLKRLKE